MRSKPYPRSLTRPRRRPAFWLLRHYVGSWFLWVGDRLQGEYRWETCAGPDRDGCFEMRPIPASWDGVVADARLDERLSV
jgi:hypothetical protein